jgi:hypothetical protein
MGGSVDRGREWDEVGGAGVGVGEVVGEVEGLEGGVEETEMVEGEGGEGKRQWGDVEGGEGEGLSTAGLKSLG